MNPTATTAATLSFDFSASSSQPEANDHLQRLAAMTQGVGKDDSDHSVAPSTDALYSAGAAAYMPGYAGWPNYYQQFGQPALAPAAFPPWPTQCYATPHWPNYAASKKGRQTYQRYQTSVLEQKFQQSSYVSKKQREELRLQTNLTDRQIKIWFQNRRMKAKKEKQRIDDHVDSHSTPLLPPNPPSKNSGAGSAPGSQSGMLVDDDSKKWLESSVVPSSAPQQPAVWPGLPHPTASMLSLQGQGQQAPGQQQNQHSYYCPP